MTFYWLINTISTGATVQSTQNIQRQSSSCRTSRPGWEFLLSVLKCLTQCCQHPHRWWASSASPALTLDLSSVLSLRSSLTFHMLWSLHHDVLLLFLFSTFPPLTFLSFLASPPFLTGAEHTFAHPLSSPDPELLSLSPFFLLSQSECADLHQGACFHGAHTHSFSLISRHFSDGKIVI